VTSLIPSGSRSWRSPPSTLLRVPLMEVERFKHRQLAPTVGRSSRSSGEFEGPIFTIDLFGAIRYRRHLNPLLRRVRSCTSIQVEAEKNSSTIGPRLNGTRGIISLFIFSRVLVRHEKRNASSSNSSAFDGLVSEERSNSFSTRTQGC
jgi:hypothetical protein